MFCTKAVSLFLGVTSVLHCKLRYHSFFSYIRPEVAVSPCREGISAFCIIAPFVNPAMWAQILLWGVWVGLHGRAGLGLKRQMLLQAEQKKWCMVNMTFSGIIFLKASSGGSLWLSVPHAGGITTQNCAPCWESVSQCVYLFMKLLAQCRVLWRGSKMRSCIWSKKKH